ADGGPPDPDALRSGCPQATEFYLQLSTEWRQYSLILPKGEPYNDELGAGGGVWNGFSIVIEPATFAGGGYVFVKDIVWGNASARFDAGVPDAGPGDAGGDANSGAAGATDAGTD